MNLSWLLKLLPWLAREEASETDEDPKLELPLPEEDTEPDPEIEPPGIRNVGVWCGLSSLKSPERDIAFCLEHRINRLDIIVNDHSKARSARDFTTYAPGEITRLCIMAHDNGIEPHLMSWIMPHDGYIKQAAERLVPLAQDCNVASVQWDAEEPWTLARRGLDYPTAAQRVKKAFENLHCPMGVNGIGYTPRKKFGPLADVCDYVVPQCYSTSSSGLRPEDVVPKFVRRWNRIFEAEKPKKFVVGLAAYRQTKIPGHTVETAMRTALAGAQALEGIDTVIYWSLRHIRKNKRVAKVIASIRRP
jgi:hypothetical protein